MALVATLVAGTTNMLSFVDSSTLGGGGGGTVTPLSRAFTAGVNGSSFTITGTFTAVTVIAVKNTNGTPSDYAGTAGLRVVSTVGGNTTVALTLPAGIDPFTGIIDYQAS